MVGRCRSRRDFRPGEAPWRTPAAGYGCHALQPERYPTWSDSYLLEYRPARMGAFHGSEKIIGASVGCMLRKRTLPRCRCDATEFARVAIEGIHRLMGISCDENFIAGREERVEAIPSVGKHGRPAGRCFKQPARRAPTHLRHIAPSHIERETRRAEESRVFARRQMAHEIHVRTPGKIVGILCSAKEETLLRTQSGRLDEQVLQRLLPIGGKCPEIR